MSELVSIITPTYNSEKFIEETIASVREQTYSNFELIIVDDCSTDRTVEIVKKFQLEDNRIRFIELDKNSGAAIARNTAIQQISGKYMTFLDGDDLWLPTFIEDSLKFSIDNHANFVFSSYMRYDEDLKPLLSDFIVPEKVSYFDILKSCPISCLTAFINVDVLGKKYMPLIQKRQDFGLWLSYLKEIDFAYGLAEPLAIYRMRKNSLSRNKWSLIKYQWQFYYEIEKLGLFSSLYYLFNWMARGFLKYRS
ncbi:MAG: glycosyltransferase family 2 protein [Maribacter arcticus]|uniref:glycosyltransferase family 2 protein n=1 Tax=Maribacter arcticus TaxID=561365 RepID=UPI0030023520